MRPCRWCGDTTVQPHFSHLDLCGDCNAIRLHMESQRLDAAQRAEARVLHPAGKSAARRARHDWWPSHESQHMHHGGDR